MEERFFFDRVIVFCHWMSIDEGVVFAVTVFANSAMASPAWRNFTVAGAEFAFYKAIIQLEIKACFMNFDIGFGVGECRKRHGVCGSKCTARREQEFAARCSGVNSPFHQA